MGVDAGVLRRAREIEPSAVVVVAGLGVGLYLQGAFGVVGQVLVAVTLVVAVFLVPGGVAVSRADVPVVVVAGVLGGWAVFRGVVTGQVMGGVRYALLLAGVLVVAGVCRRVASGFLLSGLLGVCVAVGAVGWFGVVAHHPVWGFEGPGMWRASSTLTYPNATAAVMAVAALVCFAGRANGGAPRWWGYAGTVLVTGMAATLSRAGLGAFAVGLVVLAVVVGVRAVWRAVVAPSCGALVATAGLLPSITAGSPSFLTVAVAVVGGVGGVVVGGRAATGRWTSVVLGVGLLATAGLAMWRVGSRFSLDSPDRWAAVEAAWDVFTRHPVAGVGPGLARLVLVRDGGGTGVYRYAHNEYAQVLAELGLVGGFLLAAFLWSAVRRLGSGAPVAGAFAALVALALHAGFDFVWHVPAVPLLAAAFAGVATGQFPHTEGRETN